MEGWMNSWLEDWTGRKGRAKSDVIEPFVVEFFPRCVFCFVV